MQAEPWAATRWNQPSRLRSSWRPVPASSLTMASPNGWVAPVTTQMKPYNFPSERYGEKGEDSSIGSGILATRFSRILWHLGRNSGLALFSER